MIRSFLHRIIIIIFCLFSPLAGMSSQIGRLVTRAATFLATKYYDDYQGKQSVSNNNNKTHIWSDVTNISVNSHAPLVMHMSIPATILTGLYHIGSFMIGLKVVEAKKNPDIPFDDVHADIRKIIYENTAVKPNNDPIRWPQNEHQHQLNYAYPQENSSKIVDTITGNVVTTVIGCIVDAINPRPENKQIFEMPIPKGAELVSYDERGYVYREPGTIPRETRINFGKRPRLDDGTPLVPVSPYERYQDDPIEKREFGFTATPRWITQPPSFTSSGTSAPKSNEVSNSSQVPSQVTSEKKLEAPSASTAMSAQSTNTSDPVISALDAITSTVNDIDKIIPENVPTKSNMEEIPKNNSVIFKIDFEKSLKSIRSDVLQTSPISTISDISKAIPDNVSTKSNMEVIHKNNSVIFKFDLGKSSEAIRSDVLQTSSNPNPVVPIPSSSLPDVAPQTSPAISNVTPVATIPIAPTPLTEAISQASSPVTPNVTPITQIKLSKEQIQSAEKVFSKLIDTKALESLNKATSTEPIFSLPPTIISAPAPTTSVTHTSSFIPNGSSEDKKIVDGVRAAADKLFSQTSLQKGGIGNGSANISMPNTSQSSETEGIIAKVTGALGSVGTFMSGCWSTATSYVPSTTTIASYLPSTSTVATVAVDAAVVAAVGYAAFELIDTYAACPNGNCFFPFSYRSTPEFNEIYARIQKEFPRESYWNQLGKADDAYKQIESQVKQHEKSVQESKKHIKNMDVFQFYKDSPELRAWTKEQLRKDPDMKTWHSSYLTYTEKQQLLAEIAKEKAAAAAAATAAVVTKKVVEQVNNNNNNNTIATPLPYEKPTGCGNTKPIVSEKPTGCGNSQPVPYEKPTGCGGNIKPIITEKPTGCGDTTPQGPTIYINVPTNPKACGDVVSQNMNDTSITNFNVPDEKINSVKDNSEIKHPVLDNTRTGSALKSDPYHAFNDIIDNFARFAKKFSLKNGDGTLCELYQIEGSLNGINGIFEWIVDSRPERGVTHRLFIKNGKITGKPNVF